MWKIVITEFYKNVFADIVLRLMKSTGGYDIYPFPVLGLYDCVWKNGKPSHPKQLRRATELRMPEWHRHMIEEMAKWRRHLRKKPGVTIHKVKKNHSRRPVVSIPPTTPIASLSGDVAAVGRSGAPRPILALE